MLQAIGKCQLTERAVCPELNCENTVPFKNQKESKEIEAYYFFNQKHQQQQKIVNFIDYNFTKKKKRKSRNPITMQCQTSRQTIRPNISLARPKTQTSVFALLLL